MQDNTKNGVIKWAWDALSKSEIDPDDHLKLYTKAVRMAEAGYLRGDISQAWRELGFGSDKIHDFYP